MVRRITYRYAINAFIFTGLWFVVGAIVLWSPLPGKLGIAGELLAAWLVLFFVILAAAGSALTIAALNEVFPPKSAGPRSGIPSRSTSKRPSVPSIWATDRSPSASHGNARREG